MSDSSNELMPNVSPWQCHTCGAGYAEYTNGCPVCWERGIRSKVERVPEIPEPPKVEEVARKLHAFLDSPAFKDSGKHPEDCLANFLRPYFPPASQTPEIQTAKNELLERFASVFDSVSMPEMAAEIRSEIVATPASTARTDGPHKIPSELALRHWAELIAIAALGPRNDREAYKEAAGYALGQLRGFADEYCAAPGSVPQAEPPK